MSGPEEKVTHKQGAASIAVQFINELNETVQPDNGNTDLSPQGDYKDWMDKMAPTEASLSPNGGSVWIGVYTDTSQWDTFYFQVSYWCLGQDIQFTATMKKGHNATVVATCVDPAGAQITAVITPKPTNTNLSSSYQEFLVTIAAPAPPPRS